MSKDMLSLLARSKSLMGNEQGAKHYSDHVELWKDVPSAAANVLI